MNVVIPKPYPKQAKFMRSRSHYTAYGGSRGGGKSFVARLKARMLCMRYDGIQILFMRRTYPELRENHIIPAIKELKGGRVEYRADRYGIAHVILGKASFTAEQLAENYGTVYDEVLRMKPAAAKGKYVKSISVSSTMGPGVAVDSSVTRAYTEAAE